MIEFVWHSEKHLHGNESDSNVVFVASMPAIAAAPFSHISLDSCCCRCTSFRSRCVLATLERSSDVTVWLARNAVASAANEAALRPTERKNKKVRWRGRFSTSAVHSGISGSTWPTARPLKLSDSSASLSHTSLSHAEDSCAKWTSDAVSSDSVVMGERRRNTSCSASNSCLALVLEKVIKTASPSLALEALAARKQKPFCWATMVLRGELTGWRRVPRNF